MNDSKTPIGVFDSGYGGLTILDKLVTDLPQYDFLYLGDNARSPYGSRSSNVIHKFTLQAVEYLFNKGCPLVILACNTSSARALRDIQQHYLPTSSDPTRRVLGVIRPTVEVLNKFTTTQHIGILATEGTVNSNSYKLEIEKLFPSFTVVQEACPMWVPLVENGEADSPGSDFFVRKHLDRILREDEAIDTILLACTHYPLLKDKIKRLLTPSINIISQGEIVAHSLQEYLVRHPEMEQRISQGGTVRYLTTEDSNKFEEKASLFLKRKIEAQSVAID